MASVKSNEEVMEEDTTVTEGVRTRSRQAAGGQKSATAKPGSRRVTRSAKSADSESENRSGENKMEIEEGDISIPKEESAEDGNLQNGSNDEIQDEALDKISPEDSDKKPAIIGDENNLLKKDEDDEDAGNIEEEKQADEHKVEEAEDECVKEKAPSVDGSDYKEMIVLDEVVESDDESGVVGDGSGKYNSSEAAVPELDEAPPADMQATSPRIKKEIIAGSLLKQVESNVVSVTNKLSDDGEIKLCVPEEKSSLNETDMCETSKDVLSVHSVVMEKEKEDIEDVTAEGDIEEQMSRGQLIELDSISNGEDGKPGEESGDKKDSVGSGKSLPENVETKTKEKRDRLSTKAVAKGDENMDGEEMADTSVRTEPDTEMVSDEELPTETSKDKLETEMVSDEELPSETATMPETEMVSDDELPIENKDKSPKDKQQQAKPKEGGEESKAPEETTEKTVKDGVQAKKAEPQKRKASDADSAVEETKAEEPPVKRVSVSAQAKPLAKQQTTTRKCLPELEKYWKAVKEDPSDFTGWTYLLQYVDQEAVYKVEKNAGRKNTLDKSHKSLVCLSQPTSKGTKRTRKAYSSVVAGPGMCMSEDVKGTDVDAAREAYDAFLSFYPYCYGYWRKYADYEKRRGNSAKCEEVFERGLKAIPLSVDLWIHYLNYCKGAHSSDEDFVRSQFEKALSACGKEFRSDRLWESYIKWENEGKRLLRVTQLYDRLLGIPTLGYSNHFDSFQEHIKNNLPQKVLSVDEFLTLRSEVRQVLRQYETPAVADDAPPGDDCPPGEEPEDAGVQSDEETSALREKIIAIRRKIHKETVNFVAARWTFEEGIKRPYFHVKPLERCQLKNWKEYLDFEIEQGDKERIIILFERCLIACALYEEFWVRFIRYLEGLKDDLTEKIRDVYERACTIHHKKKPNLHLHWAVFEESHENWDKAAEILSNLERIAPNMLQVAYRRINLERRRKNMDKVCSLYESYIEKTNSNKVISNNIAIKYARFCLKVLDNVDKAAAILKKALENDKENPRLYMQLIDMNMQKTPIDESAVVGIIDQFLARDFDPDMKVLFAQRKVEFLEDFGSDIVCVQKAHEEFQRYFKMSKERRKKPEPVEVNSADASIPPAKKIKTLGNKNVASSITSSSVSSAIARPTHTTPPIPSQYSTPPPPIVKAATDYAHQQQQQQPEYTPGQPYSNQYQQPQQYGQPPYSQQYNNPPNNPNYGNYQNWGGYSQTGYGYNQGWGSGYSYY